MDQQMLIVFVILVQVTNVAGAWVFGALAERWSNKQSLILSIVLMVVAVVWMYFAPNMVQFFLIGALAGFAMAGIQSVSRTFVGYLSPAGQTAEFFGFFAVAGRTSSFIGPAVYGLVAAEAALWHQARGLSLIEAERLGQRLAVLTIAVFLLVGLILLLFVNEKRAREAAVEASLEMA
jgi:UMF1 family MFS transporter